MYIEKISADFFKNLCCTVSECHNRFACWRLSIYLSTFLSVCLSVCKYVCLSICLLFICLASFYLLPTICLSRYLSVSLYVPFLSFCLSACLSIYPQYVFLSIICPSSSCPSVSLPVYVCLLDCLYTSLYICIFAAFCLSYLYTCLSDHLFVYLSDYLSAFPVPSSYQHRPNS
jgi:hypothetical protein